MGGFLCYRFGGFIFGGAYTWRGLFSQFYGMSVSEEYISAPGFTCELNLCSLCLGILFKLYCFGHLYTVDPPIT